MIAILMSIFLLGLILIGLGVDEMIYEEIMTHPKTEGILGIVGDSAYGIGISVTAAAVYGYIVGSGRAADNTMAALIGVVLIVGGSVLKNPLK